MIYLLPLFITFILLLTSYTVVALDISGLIDLRLSHTDSQETSFVDGGFGKYRYEPGTNFSVAQAHLVLKQEVTDTLSIKLITQGSIDNISSKLGYTEAFLNYRSLPTASGVRFKAKAGIMYPEISHENIATAWSSPYTLSYSTLNAWIGEEVRHLGVELGFEEIGKFSNKPFNQSVGLALFQNNDTTGTLLAYQGWTAHSRQTLWNETIVLPKSQRLFFSNQAEHSDPFEEVDNRVGYHVHYKIEWPKVSRFTLGYYDNRTRPYLIEKGQYGWNTYFTHIGIDYYLPYGVKLISQYLQGNTAMQNKRREDIVSNDFYSGFVLLTKRWGVHRLSARVERFAVKDLDGRPYDDNTDTGRRSTISYQYRINRQWFLQAEFDWTQARKNSRENIGLTPEQVERQWQIAAKYYF